MVFRPFKSNVDKVNPVNMARIDINCCDEIVSLRKINERITTRAAKDAVTVPTRGAFSILRASLNATKPTRSNIPSPILSKSKNGSKFERAGRAKGT